MADSIEVEKVKAQTAEAVRKSEAAYYKLNERDLAVASWFFAEGIIIAVQIATGEQF